MPLYRTQVELAMTSGNPVDKATNVWYFVADDLVQLPLALTQVTTFYNAIDTTLSNLIATSGHRIRCYDMADEEPRAPKYDGPIGGISPGTTTLPPEIAMCVSFQAPRESGESQARRRGRLYIGPLTQTWNTSGTGQPASANLTTLSNAVQNLLDASQAATTWAWMVYSPTNQVAIEVNDAWVDNAFDIQRRRGLAATTRTVIT